MTSRGNVLYYYPEARPSLLEFTVTHLPREEEAFRSRLQKRTFCFIDYSLAYLLHWYYYYYYYYYCCYYYLSVVFFLFVLVFCVSCLCPMLFAFVCTVVSVFGHLALD
jgi:hypothetical protein